MPPDSPAVLRNCPPQPAAVPTLKLRVLNSEVAQVRRFITLMLAGLVPAEHLEDLEVCASELVTNAIRAANAYASAAGFFWTYCDNPIHFGIEAGAQWTRLDVRDPDPARPEPAERDLLDESGRGLVIVSSLAAAVEWEYAADHKVAHVLIAMPDADEPVPPPP